MRDTLNVTHVVLSLDVGGLERNVVNQLRVGPELGQRVSVVCVERRGALGPRAEALGARVVCLDKRPGVRVGLIARMRAALRELRPDVVHTHQIGPLFYTGPAARSLGIPLLVHTEHGKERYAGRRRTRWLGRLAGLFAKRFYCLTEDMATAVTEHRIVPPRKVRVIQNGIAVDDYTTPCDTAPVRSSLGIPPAARVIGTVGRLNEIKRQDLLIRAFARVRERAPDVHLLLVGDGPLLGDLRNQAARLGVGACVHFAGYQEWTPPYLQTMDVFALTSRSEGMPQAVLEAAVTGLPIIASKVGGLPEVIEHGRSGLLFDPGDEPSLVTGLLDLLGDRERGRRLGRAARAGVEKAFHIRRMAADYQRDFLELMGRTGRPVMSAGYAVSPPGPNHRVGAE
jgi:glycosyltransferase involved in cell wall biosynthesis